MSCNVVDVLRVHSPKTLEQPIVQLVHLENSNHKIHNQHVLDVNLVISHRQLDCHCANNVLQDHSQINLIRLNAINVYLDNSIHYQHKLLVIYAQLVMILDLMTMDNLLVHNVLLVHINP